MPKRSNETFWIELGFLPIAVGYVPNATAWRETLRQLGVDDEPLPETDGRCDFWSKAGPDNNGVVLITVGKRAAKYSMSQVAGIIAHECMHAWRHIRDVMGESEPSTEFEAYAMQAMVQGVMFAHAERRAKPWRS